MNSLLLRQKALVKAISFADHIFYCRGWIVEYSAIPSQIQPEGSAITFYLALDTMGESPSSTLNTPTEFLN